MENSIFEILEHAPEIIKDKFITKTYEQDTQIISATGANKAYLYIIKSGEAEVYKESVFGSTIAVNFFKKGDIFGEVEVFTPDLKPYDVYAKTKCSIILIKKNDVFKWMSEDFDFAVHLCEMLTRRMYVTSDAMSRIALLPIKERVLGCISSHHKNGTLKDLSKNELILQIRAPLRSVNRVIDDCVKEGIIEFNHKHFKVIDDEILSLICYCVNPFFTNRNRAILYYLKELSTF